MSPRIFITGATGLIGGDYLYLLTRKYPTWDIVALVRDEAKAKIVLEHFPQVHIVHGSLDDSDLLERESERADVVLNFANCDHEAAARAIIQGLSKRKETGTVIHTSGAKIIAWETESLPYTWGHHLPRPYNDGEGVKELTNLPSPTDPSPTGLNHVLPNWAAHRNADMAILSASKTHPQIRTAIVCPPTIYGPSRFPGFTRSIQLPRYLNIALRYGNAFTINSNSNKWNMIHTQDISQLYILLTEAAVTNHTHSDALWNEHGYYFAEQGEFIWGDVIREVARIGYEKGYFKSPVPEELANETVMGFWGGGQMNVCSSSLGSARRGRELLGWRPEERGRGILGDVERALEVEARLVYNYR